MDSLFAAYIVENATFVKYDHPIGKTVVYQRGCFLLNQMLLTAVELAKMVVSQVQGLGFENFEIGTVEELSERHWYQTKAALTLVEEEGIFGRGTLSIAPWTEMVLRESVG